jgi:hypothetical protein
MFAQLIAAMAHHGYLNLEGGQRLVEFIVKQCAVNTDEEVMLDIKTPNRNHTYSQDLECFFPACWSMVCQHHNSRARKLKTLVANQTRMS